MMYTKDTWLLMDTTHWLLEDVNQDFLIECGVTLSSLIFPLDNIIATRYNKKKKKNETKTTHDVRNEVNL